MVSPVFVQQGAYKKMKNHHASFAIRFIGFSAREVNIFDATFSVEQNREKQYFRLPADSLQEPDLYLVNAESAGDPGRHGTQQSAAGVAGRRA